MVFTAIKYRYLNFILLMSIMASSALAEASEVFQNIITLGWLSDLGVGSTIDPLEGFVRILVGIALFAILFALSQKLDAIGKNVAIVISLVITLITMIFIPASVLLAAATSYATIFSVIILALPLGIGFWVYFMMGENLWIRGFIMGVLWFVLDEMKDHLNNLAQGAGGAFGASIGGTLDTYLGWVYWVVVGLFVWNIFQAFTSLATGHSHDKMDSAKTGKTLVNWATNWKRKGKTALMNDYVEEEKELKLLDEAKEQLEKLEVLVNDAANAGKINNRADGLNLITSAENVKDKLEDAKKEFRRVKGRTWRQEREFTKIVKELKSKNREVDQLNRLEKDLLMQHEKAINAIAPGLDKIHDAIKMLNKELPKVPGGLPTLKKLVKLIADLEIDISTAQEAQAQAIIEVQGIMAEAQKLYRPFQDA